MDRAISISKGVTLIELLIATFLVGLVGLAVTSVDISARRFLLSSQQDTDVQNEAGQAMAHIVENAKYGAFTLVDGNDNVGNNCGTGCDDIFFTTDIDLSDGIGPFGNVTIKRNNYTYESTDYEIKFRFRVPPGGWSSWETIARNITACTFRLENTNGDIDTAGNDIYDRLSIDITTQTTSLSGETKTTNLQSDVTLRFTGYRI